MTTKQSTIVLCVCTILCFLLCCINIFILGIQTTDGEGGMEAPIYTFEDLLDAIEQVESGGDANAVGLEGEVGSFQIKLIYIGDFNRIMALYGEEKRATYEDRWDKAESRKITSVVTCYYASYDWRDKPYSQMDFFETMARTHKNPTERNRDSTKPYWLKVKAQMEAMQ